MNDETMKKIQEEMNLILNQLSEGSTALVSLRESEEGEIVDVQIETSEQAVLIGFHGEALQSLQLIFSFLCHKLLDRWVKVIVNIGDYREKREEQLQKLALNLAMKAKFSKEAQIIPNLNSSERRYIHIVLADNPDVYTESEGEGRERQLTIKPKK